ncbi:MAG: RNA polymerase subunit sigma-70 [Thalassolituus sp.]|nr:MAG: RNA polymerase subunit sigma-70 [Thalassolituus sp.]
MKMSRRAKRMHRNHKRNANKNGLNLTALMDIFTILVFFLMVNQSEVEVQNTDSVELPVSVADSKPEEQLSVLVTKDDILVQGRPIASVAGVKASGDELIAALQKELEYHASRTLLPPELIEEGRPVTIIGDKETPYAVLKQVMTTCSKAGFNNISLAVNQKQPAGGA